MLDGDFVCRAALYPKFVTPAGIFDEEMLLNFQGIHGTENYAMSVASKFLCRTDDRVHAYGANSAELMNQRFLTKEGRPPQPVSEEVHYLGFYDFECGKLRSIKMEFYTARCYWLPENGQDVHFQAEFQRNSATATKREKQRDRRAAIGILALALQGPCRHITKADEPHRKVLEAIDLPQLPPPVANNNNMIDAAASAAAS